MVTVRAECLKGAYRKDDSGILSKSTELGRGLMPLN